MLPPVVSSGQYQMIESKTAMDEHTPMTVRAMTGPQWQSLFTSWRFSNTIIADKIFIVLIIVDLLKFPNVNGRTEVVRRFVSVYCVRRSRGIFLVSSETTSMQLRHQSQGPAVSLSRRLGQRVASFRTNPLFALSSDWSQDHHLQRIQGNKTICKGRQWPESWAICSKI